MYASLCGTDNDFTTDRPMYTYSNKGKFELYLKGKFCHTKENKYVKEGVISNEWDNTEQRLRKILEHCPDTRMQQRQKCAICGNVHLNSPMWVIIEYSYEHGEYTHSINIKNVCTTCAPDYKYWIPENVDDMDSVAFPFNIIKDRIKY